MSLQPTLKRLSRSIILFACVATLAACGLPRGGPGKKEIFEGSQLQAGDAYIVAVNDHVARATYVPPGLGFSSDFVEAGQLGSDTIRAGDMLSLTVWENVEDGLLSDPASATTAIQTVQVDGDGFIYVPYAGRIRASGNSPERVRQIITDRLNTQTPDPQVLVTRVSGDGATVSVMGGVVNQGVYPIERPTRTLSAMIARAGGISVTSEVAQVSIVRGGKRSTVWFEDLYDTPKYDIALRDGDRILIEEDTRSYTVMGATGGQTQVRFERQDLSAMQALAQVGGLNSNLADPTGIFVFREESQAVSRKVLGRNDIQGSQRFVYVLNLTEPKGMFHARDFGIRDEDTVYVTEAPFVAWQKTLSSITGSLTPVANLSTLAN